MQEGQTQNKQKHQNNGMKGQMQPRFPQNIRYNAPGFIFTMDTIEKICFKKLSASQRQDINSFVKSVPNSNSITNKLFNQFFSIHKNLSDLAYYSHQILADLTYSCPEPKISNIIIKKIIKNLVVNRQKVRDDFQRNKAEILIQKIPLQFLVQIFELYQFKIKDATIKGLMQELINKDLYTDVVKFAKILGIQLPFHIAQMMGMRLCSKGKFSQFSKILPDIVKVLKNSERFKNVYQMELIKSARYFFKSEGWQHLEEIFENYPHVVAKVISNQRISKEAFQGIVSICQRSPIVANQVSNSLKIKIQAAKYQMELQNKPILKNKLQVNQFSPSSQQYFSLAEFKFNEDQVFWVDDNLDEQRIKKIYQQILSSNIISIDTESKVARNSLDNNIELLALIQISNDKYVYLIDARNSSKSLIKEIFTDYFKNEQKKIIGHTIMEDVSLIEKFFSLPKAVCKVIDIKSVLNGQSLKAISKQILGKQICKKYCLTNWERRPLLKCQKHYAAMDAYIIFRIYQKIKEQIDAKYNEKQKKIRQIKVEK